MSQFPNKTPEKGSTTIIALLVMFALLSLGLLSMRHTFQDVSGAGNLKRAKQARYVAEVGAHHAATLLQQQGSYLLALRQPGDLLEVDSLGRIRYISRNPAGVEQVRHIVETDPFPALIQGPAPLGDVGTHIASYRVRVEGITDGPPPPGQELSQSDLGTPRQSYCLIQLSSRGYAARTSLPENEREALTEEQWLQAAEGVAEHQIKAALTVGPFIIPGCAF